MKTDAEWQAWRIQIAHEWRERHGLPRLSDAEAERRYWTVYTLNETQTPVGEADAVKFSEHHPPTHVSPTE